MKSEILKKSVSVILALLLVLGGFDGLAVSLMQNGAAGTGAYASPAGRTVPSSEFTGPHTEGKTPHPTKDFVKDMLKDKKELKEERTQNSKTFVDNRGKKTQLVFADRVHFKGQGGRWEDIDNTVTVLDQDSPRAAGAGTSDFKYINSANDYSAMFSGNGTPTVAFRYKGTHMSFYPDGANDSTPLVEGNAVLYPGIFEGTDLEYHVLNSRLKEDIILNKYTGKTSFTFSIKAEGLNLVQEGSVIKAYQKNSGQYLYQISPPYMTDADGNVNDRIQVKLNAGRGGHYTLELVLDGNWLQDKSRVYPVKVDPSLAVEASRDTYAEERYPDMLTYPQTHLYVGYDDGIASQNGSYYKKETITYMKFDTPAIPEGSAITKARLNLYKITSWDDSGKTAYLYRITENKPIHTITWNNRPSLSGPVSSAAIASSKGTYIWDITGTVKKWVKGEEPNYGLALKFENNPSAQAEVFASSEASYPGPFIYVEYEEQGGGQEPPPGDDPNTTLEVIKDSMEDRKVTVQGRASDTDYIEYTLYKDGSVQKEGVINDSGRWDIDFTLEEDTKYRVKVVPVRIDEIEHEDEEGNTWTEEIVVRGSSRRTDPFLIYRAQDGDNIFSIIYHYYMDDSSELSLPEYMDKRDILLQANKEMPQASEGVPIIKVGQYILIPDPDTDRPASEDKPMTITRFIEEFRRRYGDDANIWPELEPVNPHTGNYFAIQTDLKLDAPGMPLMLQRTYNTRMDEEYVGMFGRRWSFIYDRRLSFFPDGTIGMTTGDGDILYFRKQGGGYGLPHGIQGTFEKSSSGYVYRDKNGKTYRFNQAGFLQDITDRNQNTISFTYNQAGLVSIITDTAGRDILFNYNGDRLVTDVFLPGEKHLHYEYDSRDNLTAFTNLDGNTTRYTYDSRNRLVSLIDPRGNIWVENTYDSQDRVIRQKDQFGNISYIEYHDGYTGITDARGNTKTVYYDQRCRLTKTVYPEGETEEYTYDSDDNRKTYKDPKGNLYRYEYDSRGNPVKVIDPAGNTVEYTYDNLNNITQIKDPEGNSTTFDYDSRGNLIKITDPEGNETVYSYNSRGQVTSVTDPDGNTTGYIYDSEGNLTEVINPGGNSIKYTRDDLGRVIGLEDAKGSFTRIITKPSGLPRYVQMPEGVEVEYTYDKNGNVTSVKDPEGNITYYTYDAMDRVKAVQDPLGGITLTEYDANGNRTKITDPEGAVTTFGYDRNNRLVCTTGPEGERTEYTYDKNGNVKQVKDPAGNITEYMYDQLNRLVQVKDPAGNITEYEYDSLGNVTNITLPDGSQIEYGYTDISQLERIKTPDTGETRLSYDGSGRLKEITNPGGNTFTYTYTPSGNLSTIQDPLGNITGYLYDKNNNLISVTNALGKEVQYRYDALNRLIAITDPLGNTTEIEYDLNGNSTKIKDPEGNTTMYAYDALNRPVTVTDAKGNTTGYGYDPAGNLVWVKDARGYVTAYDYDKSGRLTRVTDPRGNTDIYDYDNNGRIISRTKPDGSVTGYSYDALDRLAEIEYPDGSSVTYTYDIMGNRTSMEDDKGTTTYTYDIMNRLTSVTNPLGETVEYSYDILGRKEGMVYPDGREVQYVYDELNRLKKVTDWSERSTRYTYDEIGRRTATQLPDGIETLYTYDDANRLVEIKNTDGNGNNLSSFRYTYDRNGNRIKEIFKYREEEQKHINYTYDSLNQLTGVEYSCGEKISYTYDQAGNRIKMEKTNGEGSDVTNYSYNSLNQLTEITKNSGDYRAEYLYDANGNRIKLTEPGHRETIYTYDYEDRLLTLYRHRIKQPGENSIPAEDTEESEEPAETEETAEEPARPVMQPAVNKPDKVKGNGKGEEETQDALSEGEQAGVDAATQGLFGLPQEGNEDIYQTFGYDGDGNRLFKTVTITKYAPPFEGDMPLPPGKEKTNNGKGKSNDKKQLSLISVPELVMHMAKADKGKGKSNNNGKGSSKDKGNNGNANGRTKEKTNNGLHLGWYKRADHPHYPGMGEVIGEEFRATNYVNDINRDYPEVLMVSDEEGSYTASYLYGIERIMAENVEGLQPDRFDPLYYLYDGLGSATQLVNGDGEVWNKFMYEPYGRPKATGKLLLNRHKEELLYVPFGFTGEAHDFYSGLIYLRARYYDPEVGSFISRDSYLGSLMRPLSQNRYIYVKNNPVNYVDPSGHWGQIAAGFFGGAAVGLVGTLVTDIVTNVARHGLSIKEYELSSIETYAANTVGAAVGGAILAGTGNIYGATSTASSAGRIAASLVGSIVSSGGRQGLEMLTGGKDEFDTGGFIWETFSGTLTGLAGGKIANKLIPRGPGAPPTRLVTALTGKVAIHTLWQRGIAGNLVSNTLKEGLGMIEERFSGYQGEVIVEEAAGTVKILPPDIPGTLTQKKFIKRDFK